MPAVGIKCAPAPTRTLLVHLVPLQPPRRHLWPLTNSVVVRVTASAASADLTCWFGANKTDVKRDASLSGQRKPGGQLSLCKGECYRRLFDFMDAANHSELCSVRCSAFSGPHTQAAQIRAVSCTFKPVFSAIHPSRACTPISQAAMATMCSATERILVQSSQPSLSVILVTLLI